MKVDWKKVAGAFGSYNNFATECKDTDYDTDGGFWDDIGDWWGGEDFDYSSVDKALGNFYSCVAGKLVQVDLFLKKLIKHCNIVINIGSWQEVPRKVLWSLPYVTSMLEIHMFQEATYF